MENNNKRNPISLMYRVDINPNSQWYNQSKSGAMALTPFEFKSSKSPLVARRKAFKFVKLKDRPIKAYDLNVYLVDIASGNEYLIHNGQEPSAEVLKNLELEGKLYYLQGYEFEWALLSDPKWKDDRTINQPSESKR